MRFPRSEKRASADVPLSDSFNSFANGLIIVNKV